MMGFMTWVVGILSDTIASERKILEDTQYHARRADYTAEELKKRLAGETPEAAEKTDGGGKAS